MNKFYNLVLVLLCLWVPGRAQVVEDTISLEAMIERAMSELDFSPVQSGIMIDKVPRYVDYAYLKYKAGIPPDSVFLPGTTFPLLYGMIDRAHTGTSPLTEIEEWYKPVLGKPSHPFVLEGLLSKSRIKYKIKKFTIHQKSLV